VRIVYGNPTPEEIAALIVALSLVPRAPAQTASSPRSSQRSTDPWREEAEEVSTRHWREWPSRWRDVAPLTGRPLTLRDRSWPRQVS
jgi:hypothetical protein